MVKTMCGEAEAQKLTSIPLSDKQRMYAIASNKDETLTEQLKNSLSYALQMDVSCEGRDTHALTFVRYKCQGMLFTKTYCSVSQFLSMK
jgi:hypothetical protein